jgi:PII-like signaling protein
MELPRDAVLLRIFVEERDEHEGQPLFRKIVLKAREMRLAGATVLRGPLGFGRSTQLHASNIFQLSFDVPIVIEIVETEQKIQEFLAAAEDIFGDELITLEKVQAIFYKGKSAAGGCQFDRRCSGATRSGP